MTASAPRDSTLAVVGDGFGSLIVYSTAIYLGFKPEEITVYERAAGRNVVTLVLKGVSPNTGPYAAFNSDDAVSNRPEVVITN